MVASVHDGLSDWADHWIWVRISFYSDLILVSAKHVYLHVYYSFFYDFYLENSSLWVCDAKPLNDSLISDHYVSLMMHRA
jgi:hypothetical protein